MNRELDNGLESESTLTDESESLLPIDEHEEVVSENGKKVLRRGIFLLPNLMAWSWPRWITPNCIIKIDKSGAYFDKSCACVASLGG